MKCSKCGSELKEGEKFCENCGTEITIQSGSENQVVLNNVSNYEKNSNINSQNKGKKIIIILIIIVLLAIGGLVYYFNIYKEEKDNKNINDSKNENNNQIQNNTTTTRMPSQNMPSKEKISSETEVDHSSDNYSEYYYLLERLNSKCGSDDINLFVNGWDSLNDTTMVSIALDSLTSDSMTYFDLSKIKEEYPNALDSGYGIKYDTVLEKAKKIFGNDISILNKRYYCARWGYVSTLDAYFPLGTLDSTGAMGCMPSNYTLVISSVVENGNNLTINVYGARERAGNYDYLRKDGSVIKPQDIKNYMQEHLDEFNLFELTFVKENGNYIITNIVNK